MTPTDPRWETASLPDRIRRGIFIPGSFFRKESLVKYFRLSALLMLLLSISVTSLSLGCRAEGEVSDDRVGADVDLGD